MHFPTVDDIFSLNSNTLMLIPTSWCKFQHVDANSNKLMHIPTVDAYFLSINEFCLIFPQKKGTKLILTTTKQRLPKAGHVDALSNNLMPFSYCFYATFQQVDAPVPTVDASFILLLKLLFC